MTSAAAAGTVTVSNSGVSVMLCPFTDSTRKCTLLNLSQWAVCLNCTVPTACVDSISLREVRPIVGHCNHPLPGHDGLDRLMGIPG